MPSIHLAERMPGRHGPLPADQATPSSDDSLFRSVFDNTLEAVVVTDDDGRILEANAEACYLFGRTIERMRSSHASDLIDVTDPRVAQCWAGAKAALVQQRYNPAKKGPLI